VDAPTNQNANPATTATDDYGDARTNIPYSHQSSRHHRCRVSEQKERVVDRPEEDEHPEEVGRRDSLAG
jgi:hypothetical protein